MHLKDIIDFNNKIDVTSRIKLLYVLKASGFVANKQLYLKTCLQIFVILEEIF